VVATTGTSLSEAVDDVTAIRQILAETPFSRAFIHVDAALSGLPLALLPPELPVGFDLTDGADCVSVSLDKFFGAHFPAGIVVTRRSLKTRMGGSVELLGTHDATIGGSRIGHTPLILSYALHRTASTGSAIGSATPANSPPTPSVNWCDRSNVAVTTTWLMPLRVTPSGSPPCISSVRCCGVAA
jgi:histidine decarboxylase